MMPARMSHAVAAYWVTVLAALCVPATASAALVRLIDVDPHADHTNIVVQFACSVRYLSNTPLSHGNATRISLRLGPDCGQRLANGAPEFPQVGGGAKLVTAARLESAAPGEVFLEFEWSHDMDFVMTPTDGAAGLRIRLSEPRAPSKGTGFVYEALDSEVFSVNLDAARSPFDQATVAATAAAYGAQAYVSEIDIDDEHWFRLRLGPFTTRREAMRVIDAALEQFPRAWIAVDDEPGARAPTERAGVPTAAVAAADPALPETRRAEVLNDARGALHRSQYAEAIDPLTRLVRQPEYPARAEAQEMLGLARERNGQLAQAKAEYQDYLLHYPQTAGAERVRRRLQALIAASIAPRDVAPRGARDDGWSVVGSAALGYQYEKGQTLSAGTVNSNSSDSAALVHGDLLVRERGARFDFTGRLDAADTRISGSTPTGGQDQTSAAFVELTDRSLGLTGRIGRQALASQSIIGLFDGLSTGYRIDPEFSISAAAGYPVYTDYDGFSREQRFETVGVEYSPDAAWTLDAYVLNETEGGVTDRRSLGVQSRFSTPGSSAIALLDYDFYFNQLDAVTLIGNFRAGEVWVFGFNLDHRRTPSLELHNALIGQTITNFAALEAAIGVAQMKQLALDRTPMSDTLVFSATRPLGERWQIMTDLGALRLGSTPASDGVPGTPSSGVVKYGDVQLAASNLWRANDLHIFGVRFDDSPLARSTSVSWDARFPIGGAWRFGPRFSVERADDHVFGGRQTVYLPEVRSDWSSRRQIFEMIAGYQVQQQVLQTQADIAEPASIGQRTMYVSVTYRLRF